jgi:hypothetical protein
VSLDGAPTRERVVDVTPTFSQRHIRTNAEGTRLWVTTPHEGIALFDLAAGRLLARTTAVAPYWPSDTRLLPDRMHGTR